MISFELHVINVVRKIPLQYYPETKYSVTIFGWERSL